MRHRSGTKLGFGTAATVGWVPPSRYSGTGAQKGYKLEVTVKGIERGTIDDRGQEQGSVTFIGTFERCDDTQVPRPFKRGSSYDSCLTYLIPGGGSIDEGAVEKRPVERERRDAVLREAGRLERELRRSPGG